MQEDTLAVAAGFVETTSLAAARALAAWYRENDLARQASPEASSSLGSEDSLVAKCEYIVTERQQNGRTVYRIKPRTLEASAPAEAATHLPEQQALAAARSFPKKGSLRLSKSIPGLRSKGIKSIMPDAQGFYRPTDASSQQAPKLVLSASANRLTLAEDDKEQRLELAKADTSGDVLGKLLGWDPPSAEETIADQATLPADLVVKKAQARPVTPEPSGVQTPEHPSTASIHLPPDSSARSSPFGNGVRGMTSLTRKLSKGHRPLVPLELPKLQQTPSHETVRESADEHRSKRPRYEDPNIYDVLQALESRAAADSPRHTRTTSMTSIDSNLSEASHVTATQITVVSAPGDDPRFVIWGERKLPQFERRGSGQSDTFPSPPMNSSKRWSWQKERKSVIPGGSEGSQVASFTTQRVMMAATVERWIAELTSKIDDELISAFSLTYRHFMTSHELLQAFITRFDWALASASRPEDEAAKRIARVRTFLVVRHWLLNYFQDDFAGDKELRTMLCNWLNTMSKSERVRSSPKDHQLVRSLKKVVRRTKDKFAHGIPLSPPSDASDFSGSRSSLNIESDAGRSSVRLSTVPETILERPSAETASPPKLAPAVVIDSDVDLDIEASGSALKDEQGSKLLMPVTPPRARRKEAEPGTPKSSSPKKKQTTPRRTMSAGRLAEKNTFALPSNHGKMSKAVSSTVGQFGRFKRLLRKANSSDEPVLADLELEANEAGDLLYVKGGLQPYLQFFDLQERVSHHSAGISDSGSSMSPTDSSGIETPAVDSDFSREAQVRIADSDERGLGILLDQEASEPPALHHSTSSQTIKTVSEVAQAVTPPAKLRKVTRPVSSSSESSPGGPPPPSGRVRPLFASSFITQDGDLDLSDSDDSFDASPGPALRRMPAARNFKQAVNLRALFPRKSSETISSVGTDRSTSFWRRSTSPAPPDVTADQSSPIAPFVVNNFVPEGLDSDDEEPGDVEAALRRLEGHISESTKAENARRVDTQLKKSAAIAARRKGLSHTRRSATEPLPDDTIDQSPTDSTATSLASSAGSGAPASSVLSSSEDVSDAVEDEADPAETPVAASVETSARPESPVASRTTLAPPAPSVISRKPSMKRLLGAPAKVVGFTARLKPPTPSTPVYHSFLLHCKTEHVAQQLTLIERDLLLSISWPGLLQGDWRHQTCTETLSWETYLKQRRKVTVETKSRGERSGPLEIQDTMTRFNLVANWCASEILSTVQFDERVALLNKFIRLAWKCYRMSNFQTLTQIVLGLQSPYVARLRQSWSRIGVWERRVFDDLKAFVASFGNFAALRRVMTAMLEGYGPLGAVQGAGSPNAQRTSRNSSAKKDVPASGCVPFIGIFLRDLALINALPTFLDPTSPSVPVEDRNAPLLDPAQPDAFAHLPPLPHDLTLRPLVNVHKQRTLAVIVERVLVFQEMATHYTYEANSSLFRKCFALSCLPTELMAACSLRCER